MEKVVVKQRYYFLAIVVIATVLLSSCQNKPKQPTGCENMPEFEKRFPERTVVTSEGSTAFTFSSMEEAEWKLLNIVPHNDFYDAFEQVLSSDPSSMDYSFDSLLNYELSSSVYSDDGRIRCFGIMGYAPSLIVQYRINDEVRLAEVECVEDCYYCLSPDTIFSFNTVNTNYYIVWGYNGQTGSGNCYKLMAYKLDSTGLHPAFVFPPSPYSGGQYLYTEICNNDELFDALAENHFRSLVRFDKDKLTFYLREFVEKEADGYGCSTKMTNHYMKYVWDGNKFVLEK